MVKGDGLMDRVLYWVGRLPLRLKAVVLVVLVLVPIMLIATRIFPPEHRKTILVVSCFALAALYVFFGTRRKPHA
jgi:hypothetical protein